MSDGPLLTPKSEPGNERDVRLYVTQSEGWDVRIASASEKMYCYLQNPGEKFFHLITAGEIYLERGDERYCLNCAMRHGYITDDRLHWQHRSRNK